MYAVKTPEDQTTMMARLVRAWFRAQKVTVTYMKPEYDQPRVRTWHIADIFVSEDGHICVLAWDSYHDEIRTFNADRVTHYTVHQSRYDTLALSDDQAAAAEATPELDEDETRSVGDEWELAAMQEAATSDWFEARGLEALAQRAWENAQFAWRMADADGNWARL